ncbi:MAG: SDR family oxidoreductase [Lachnospiraceae bacterium]|nr:SDR family oxidoreductase [Lachnospiraceae bacterium]
MDILLKGKVAFVTGCDQGIGYSICETFVKSGAIIYANVLNKASEDKLKNLNQAHYEGQVIPVCFDVTDKIAVYECIKKIKKEQDGVLDIIVNNAGVKKDGVIEMIDDASISKMFDVNVIAAVHVVQAAIRLLKKRSCGTIINMASIVGEKGNAGQSVYGATKGG